MKSIPVSAGDLLARRRLEQAGPALPNIPGLLPIPGAAMVRSSAFEPPKVDEVAKAAAPEEPETYERIVDGKPVMFRRVRDQFQGIFQGPPSANVMFPDGSQGRFGPDGLYAAKNAAEYTTLKQMLGVHLVDPKLLGM